MRRELFAAVLICSLVGWAGAHAALRARLITESTAAQHGLTRAWFTQVHLDRAVGQLRHMVLHRGTLFLQTDRAVLHAVDAETGRTLWSTQVGRRGHPSMSPGVNDDLVAVINGSYLFILNRFNGKILWKIDTRGAPGAGAALSEKRAYVPMVDGMVASYRLETLKNPLQELMKLREEELTAEEKEQLEAERRETIQLSREYIPPLLCRAWGRIFLSPVVTVQTEGEEMVAWATDEGDIFVGRIDRSEEDRFTIRYRLETSAEIVGRPTYRPPDPSDPTDRGTLYAASRDGFIYAVRAHDGELLWRYAAGQPLVQSPVYVAGHVFGATQLGGMHCLDARTGVQRWWAPYVMQFVAMSKKSVYVVDHLDRLIVLDLQTGTRLHTIPIPGYDFRLINAQTDRIYLADRHGLVVCLHEIELREPLQHVPQPAAGKSSQPAAQPESEEAAEEPAAAPTGQSPFGPPGPAPFGQPAERQPGGGAAAGQPMP